MRMIRPIDLTRAGFMLGALSLSLPAAGQMASAPAPTSPETVSRTPEGAVTVRAIRIPDALRIDGRLDESIYRDTPAIGGFI